MSRAEDPAAATAAAAATSIMVANEHAQYAAPFPLQSRAQGAARPPRRRQQPHRARWRIDRARRCRSALSSTTKNAARSCTTSRTTGERFLVARGGRGGKGNARFATSTHQAPTEHEPGKPGQERRLRLELKLLADVGLVGFPNAGKSTLISRISAARPKIADYPFTTLEPNLGVVKLDDFRSFVVADIPGLIEGAHLGHGLGTQFLRHIERTKLLVHLVDVSDASGRDPVEDFETVMRELASFNEDLAKKPMIVVASKMDAAQDHERVASLKRLGRNAHESSVP